LPAKKQTDLTDVAIIVSVKFDSNDRLTNLNRLTGFYEYFGHGAEIILIEQGETPQISSDNAPGTQALFIRDTGCHWKTRNMNLGAQLSTRPILLMTDCDTIPHPDALAKGLERMKDGVEYVNLYNGLVLDVSKERAGSIQDWNIFFDDVKSQSPSEIDPELLTDDAHLKPLYGNARYRAIGGCFLIDRRAFVLAGGWNENFVSYGYEDMELDARLRTLGVNAERLEDYSLFHFAHDRGWDSRYATFYHLNKREYQQVSDMGASELQDYAHRGFRALSFDHDHDYVRENDAENDIWRKVPPGCVDLSDLTILVLADAESVTYDRSCLAAFSDYLEGHFWNYDLQLHEIGGTHYKHIEIKRNVAYHSWKTEPDDAALTSVQACSGRSFYYELHLSSDAAAQLSRAMSVFERVRMGEPMAQLFGKTDRGE